jgi:tetratricopeptide (TPR) repeat protein
MRAAIILAFTALLSAQSPKMVPGRADARSAAELLAVEKQLLGLVENPAAAQQDPFRTALVHGNLGGIYSDLGDAQRAERSYLKARSVLEGANRTPEIRTLWARTLNNLASMYLETGQYGKAERVIDLLRTAEVTDEEDRVRIKGTEAGLHRVLGRSREAEEAYLALLRYWEAKNNFREAAIIMNNLGAVSMDRHDPRTAASRFRQSIDLWRRASGGADLPPSLVAVANYGAALLVTGNKKQARDLLREAMYRAIEWHGNGAPATVQITAMYAAALEATGEKKEARRILAEVKGTSAAFAPTDHTVC